ncbi:MAG: hypothetical protein AABW59_01930 [archaeon]
MVAPNKRRLQYKHRKSTSQTKREYFKGKGSQGKCAAHKIKMGGVINGRSSGHSKKSVTQKRPSVPFGGVLSGPAREQVFLEMGKVVAGVKKIDEVPEKYRNYVKQALCRAE